MLVLHDFLRTIIYVWYVIIFQELYRLDALTKIKYSRCSFMFFTTSIYFLYCLFLLFSILAAVLLLSFFTSIKIQFFLHSDFRRFCFLFLRRYNPFSGDFSLFKRQRSPVILLIIFIFIFLFSSNILNTFLYLAFFLFWIFSKVIKTKSKIV